MPPQDFAAREARLIPFSRPMAKAPAPKGAAAGRAAAAIADRFRRAAGKGCGGLPDRAGKVDPESSPSGALVSWAGGWAKLGPHVRIPLHRGGPPARNHFVAREADPRQLPGKIALGQLAYDLRDLVGDAEARCARRGPAELAAARSGGGRRSCCCWRCSGFTLRAFPWPLAGGELGGVLCRASRPGSTSW